jgi:hypothetical protein
VEWICYYLGGLSRKTLGNNEFRTSEAQRKLISPTEVNKFINGEFPTMNVPFMSEQFGGALFKFK